LIRSFLAGVDLCRAVSDSGIDQLASIGTARTLSTGEMIFQRNPEDISIVGVCNGFLKADVVIEDGGRFLVDVLGPGEFFGFESVLGGRTPDVTLRAACRTTVAVLRGRSLEPVLHDNEALYRNVLCLMAVRYAHMFEQLQTRCMLDAEAALATRLARLLTRHGVPAPSGGVTLPYRMSQEDLGALIGVTREAAGRVLRRWDRKGWVDLGYARFVARRPDAIRELCIASVRAASAGALGARALRSDARQRRAGIERHG
jgi:CRP/FNR family transcriptional regulator, cyclic AMP receptor protein